MKRASPTPSSPPASTGFWYEQHSFWTSASVIQMVDEDYRDALDAAGIDDTNVVFMVGSSLAPVGPAAAAAGEKRRIRPGFLELDGDDGYIPSGGLAMLRLRLPHPSSSSSHE